MNRALFLATTVHLPYGVVNRSIFPHLSNVGFETPIDLAILS